MKPSREEKTKREVECNHGSPFVGAGSVDSTSLQEWYSVDALVPIATRGVICTWVKGCNAGPYQSISMHFSHRH